MPPCHHRQATHSSLPDCHKGPAVSLSMDLCRHNVAYHKDWLPVLPTCICMRSRVFSDLSSMMRLVASCTFSGSISEETLLVSTPMPAASAAVLSA